jgi:hypothetical protein
MLAQTSSYVGWANVDESNTDTFAGTASYVTWANVDESNTDTFAGTASYAMLAQTSSYVGWANVDESNTDTFAGTASYAMLAQTSSYVGWANVDESNTDTFAGTASYVTWANVDESNTDTFAGTSSFATTAQTALSVAYSNVTGITNTSQFAGTASYALKAESLLTGITIDVAQITASAIQVTNLNVVTVTSSIIYASGSNIFGNSLSNTHQFTGSVSITGSLTVDKIATVNTLVINTTGTPATVITNEITGITTPTVIDSFADTAGYAAKWFVSVRDGSGNYRASEVMAAWNSTGNVTVFTEYSTVDIGNTDPLVLSAVIDGGNNVTLVATPASGNWSVRITRILM